MESHGWAAKGSDVQQSVLMLNHNSTNKYIRSLHSLSAIWTLLLYLLLFYHLPLHIFIVRQTLDDAPPVLQD